MGEKQEGYFLSYKTLGAIATLIAILAALGGSVTQVSSWEYRLTSLETKDVNDQKTAELLTQEIKNLRGEITTLTITLREVQIKQELGPRSTEN